MHYSRLEHLASQESKTLTQYRRLCTKNKDSDSYLRFPLKIDKLRTFGVLMDVEAYFLTLGQYDDAGKSCHKCNTMQFGGEDRCRTMLRPPQIKLRWQGERKSGVSFINHSTLHRRIFLKGFTAGAAQSRHVFRCLVSSRVCTVKYNSELTCCCRRGISASLWPRLHPQRNDSL